MKTQNLSSKRVIIFFGPPGSGKGTQAQLLADKFNLQILDTGSLLRQILNDPKNKNNKEIQKERKLNEAGILNAPAFVLKMLSKKVKELSHLGYSIILTGSPRTLFETSGDSKNSGLLDVLKKEYGAKYIKVFNLDIPEEETTHRNSNRTSCSVCKATFMAEYSKMKSCPFCGGKIEHRKDDNKQIIATRLNEYRDRTLPVLEEIKKNSLKVVKIDGTPPPYKIFAKLVSYF